MTPRLLLVVNDNNVSADILNNVLLLISQWAYKWEMLFNPDPTKPASSRSSIFKKEEKSISSNNERVPYKKHLGVLLDKKFIFKN